MIRKESMPGSRTQLYGGGAQSFFENFRRSIDVSERFVKSKVEVIESILAEWKDLPESEKESADAKKLQEVVVVFEAWFSSYLDLLSEYNVRFNERMRELERQLLQI